MDASFDTQGWDNEDQEFDAGFFDKLPVPLLWRVLVMPVRPREVSKGGILIAKAAQDAQGYLNYTGKIISLGPLAGSHERLGGKDGKPADWYPRVGDYVGYGRYTGQPVTYKGVKLLVCNDDELIMRIPDPSLLTIHV